MSMAFISGQEPSVHSYPYLEKTVLHPISHNEKQPSSYDYTIFVCIHIYRAPGELWFMAGPQEEWLSAVPEGAASSDLRRGHKSRRTGAISLVLFFSGIIRVTRRRCTGVEKNPFPPIEKHPLKRKKDPKTYQA